MNRNLEVNINKALLATLALLLTGGMAFAKTLFVSYSDRPDPANLIAYDLSILSPEAEFDIEKLHRAGNEAYAYISVGELAKDAPFRSRVKEAGIPILGHNKIWEGDLLDLSDPTWQAFVVDELAKQAVDKHFDGFFLDTADVVDQLSEAQPDKAHDYRAGLIRIIKNLKARYPKHKIILNRGFTVMDEVLASVDGVLLESLFQTYDFEKKAYKPVDPRDSDWALRQARRLQRAKLPIYIIDYVDPENQELAVETARRILKEGFTPFITTPDLMGEVLAPLRLKKRTAFIIYGNKHTKPEDLILWPCDSFTARYLQMPLEYLGVEAFYHHIEDPLPQTLGTDICGIIVDRTLQVPASREAAFLDWLIQQKNKGFRLVFLGEFPIENEALIPKLAKEFGLRGSLAVSAINSAPEIEKVDSAMIGFEASPVPQTMGYLNLQAPVQSEVYLRLRAKGKNSQPIYFEPTFTTSWGGMAHPAYSSFVRADLIALWVIDPFEFLSRSLQIKPFPVPDTTTRDGLRIFYSHIDGDGFSNFSSVKDGEMSAEIIRDRILKKFPIPITVSVIEAEIRGIMQIQPRGISRRLMRIARSIFALPNVQAASHTYSHPFVWIDGDPEGASYKHRRLPLKEAYQGKAGKGKIDYHREIHGSVKYIEEKLLPPDKKVEIFLWSGNCRPPAAALREVRELGIQNMNGGDTVITPAKPSLTCVAPRTMQWDGELQIFAANQNENVYTNDWTGPLFGTFRQVIETFKMTEEPRRLKPVNIYYHFYSADRPDAFRGLEMAYEWAMDQPLHAITATEYARIVGDSRNTAVYETLDGGWVMVNDGYQRTFRIPKSLGFPDLDRSVGIIGYKVEGNDLYLHTSGTGKAVLYLSRNQPAGLFLVSSSAPGACRRRQPDIFEYSFQDYRACEIVVGGIAAGRKLQARCEEFETEAEPAEDGTVRLKLPKNGTLVCKLL